MDKVRILLVDDEEDLVFTMAERLNIRGYDTDAVTDGAEALVKVRDKIYDVVVLDVRLPGVSGLSVLKSIKHENPDMPVILMTGHGDTGDAKEGIRTGACDYLLKPVMIEDLIKTLEAALKRKD